MLQKSQKSDVSKNLRQDEENHELELQAENERLEREVRLKLQKLHLY